MAGLLTDKQSIATGLLIGLMVWTVTRLVDGITSSGTIEYAVAYNDARLADGRPAKQAEVTLTNLSTETSVSNLQVVIHDPDNKTQFSAVRDDSNCIFEPPAWVEGSTCDPHNVGMTFNAPMLVPGTYVRVGIKYTQSADAKHDPVVRIRPGDGTSKFQLVKPGLRTLVARHEAALLLVLMGVTIGLFMLSVAAKAAEHKE
jgi:hypothetical protein